MEQDELPGTQVMKTTVPARRLALLAIDMGRQIGLAGALDQIKELQDQHPKVAGLTLARAILEKDIATAQARVSRVVLTVATTAGMPIENHGIASHIEDGQIVLTALPGEE